MTSRLSTSVSLPCVTVARHRPASSASHRSATDEELGSDHNFPQHITVFSPQQKQKFQKRMVTHALYNEVKIVLRIFAKLININFEKTAADFNRVLWSVPNLAGPTMWLVREWFEFYLLFLGTCGKKRKQLDGWLALWCPILITIWKKRFDLSRQNAHCIVFI